MNFDFHITFNTQGVKTSQNHWELQVFLDWIKKEFQGLQTFNYLEIGSYAGESLYYISHILPRHSSIVLVDLGDNSVARAILHRVMEYCGREFGHSITLISGSSRDREVIDKVTALNKNYDLCFIDANHSFDYARADYENYGPLATRVAFHDISRANIERSKEKYNGVYQAVVGHLWESIKASVNQHCPVSLGYQEGELDNWFEIVDNRDTLEKPRGFGIIYGGKFG